MYYSPLRYPGGKGKLKTVMKHMLECSGKQGGTFIEPFAGGAAVSLSLLLEGTVSHIVLNDKDKAIFAFWSSILEETDRFINKIYTVPLTIEEWQKQRSILKDKDSDRFSLGVAAFYLNRTNRSGILSAGVMGGKNQEGKWKLDARFNRNSLAKRIEKIGERKDDISVYNEDFERFLAKELPQYGSNIFLYLDPPYYVKGKQLYEDYFTKEDHIRLQKCLKNISCDWVCTYDDVPDIRLLYEEYLMQQYDLHYSAGTNRAGRELMIFSASLAQKISTSGGNKSLIV